MLKTAKNQAGSILLVTVLILSTILMISLAASSLALQSIAMNRNQEWSTGAYFAAEAGAEKIVYETWRAGLDLQTLGSCNGDGRCLQFNAGGTPINCNSCNNANTKYNLPNGAYFQIKYSLDAISGTTTLDCLGFFHGTRRSVQVQY